MMNKYYMILNLIDEWRTWMLILQDLIKMKTQLMYLIAIIWSRNEEKFIWLTELLIKKKCHWFWEMMMWRNIEYQIQLHNRRKKKKIMIKLIKKKKQQYSMSEQIIIYYNIIKKIKRLTAILRCIYYYHKIKSRTEKRKII